MGSVKVMEHSEDCYLRVSIGFWFVPFPLVKLSFGTDSHQLRVQRPNAHKLSAVLQNNNKGQFNTKPPKLQENRTKPMSEGE